MKKLKILVFDDSEIHRKTAKLTLEGHDLTIVGTYDEAQEALLPVRDDRKAERILPELLEKAGLVRDFDPYEKNKDATKAYKTKYRLANDKARDLATTYPDFDVVMTDLLVPASRQAQGGEGERLVGQEMPLGTTIALLALSAGVRNVAVVTDKNHHHHPASAALDCFGMNRLPGVNILCTNNVGYVQTDEATGKPVSDDFLKSEAGIKKYPYPEGQTWGERKGLVLIKGKDWGDILNSLLSDNTGEIFPKP